MGWPRTNGPPSICEFLGGFARHDVRDVAGMRHVILAIVLSSSIALACYVTAPSQTSSVAVGQALVSSLSCTSCHGADLSGFGIAPNLTPDPSTGLGSWSDDDIARAIRTGVDDEGAPLCNVMPRFTLADDQTTALIAYLRSLSPIDHDVPPSDCTPTAPDLDDAGLDDAGVVIVTDDAPSTCDGFAFPTTSAPCHACSGASCQANGCFGGYFCDLATLHCVPPPPGCD